MKLLTLTWALTTASVMADWPQWRGPGRDGVSTDTTPIADSLPKEGPAKVWESEFIPSDHYGGHGSPVIAGEQAFISVVWHDRVPSEQREIDVEVVGALNYRGASPELAKKIEDARLNLPVLRGAKFDEWVTEWRKQNLTPQEEVSLGSWVTHRFKAGKTAFAIGELEKVAKRQDKPFPSVEALKNWMNEEKLSPALQEKLLSVIPTTIKVAKDVILCLDMNTGKEVWRFSAEGKPTGRSSSSTAAVANGRVFAAGSTHLYCLNQKDGKMLWKADLPAQGPAASPLVVEDRVYMTAGRAQAFSVEDGKLLWEQKEARGNTSSPTYWQPSTGKPVLVVNGSSSLYGLSALNGQVLWTVPGGGQSTPVVSGDWLVLYSGSKDVGLRAYQAQKAGPPQAKWSHFWVTLRYSGSPIIHEDHVYLTCGGKHQCVDLASGKVLWTHDMESTITSPVMADGKLMVLENGGSHLGIIKASPNAYEELARIKVTALGCSSPAISNGRLVLRQKDKLVCFDLRPSP